MLLYKWEHSRQIGLHSVKLTVEKILKFFAASPGVRTRGNHESVSNKAFAGAGKLLLSQQLL